MRWTERDEQVFEAIEQWENEALNHETTDIQKTFDKWFENQLNRLDPKLQDKVYTTIDSLLFHFHALIQNSQFQLDSTRRLLTEARLFNSEIKDLSDMKLLTVDQLIYIAEHQLARQRLVSFAQGGLAGTGSLLLLGLDIPALLAINLRTVQSIAMTYGYQVSMPAEMMISLKVFHMATLPKQLQKQEWDKLEEEIREGDDFHPYFYEGGDELTDGTWLHSPLKQLGKGLAIIMLRKKLIQGIPLFGIAFGAGMNYRFSKSVSEVAHKFYQKRFLMEKQ
ncbi:EcsC family protein [Pseudalkalibacillus caeni]|uniref:EcsC family protein n=1 Tax=Exobacillus caeni TaxID=2574798 RepID=A0A5R9F7V0_9BACL|nr:EcsC family protein [Pseudalkalibacillus caeni]TLS39111.1 EcsC family protein [Pseudalkalibacillus caeni]